MPSAIWSGTVGFGLVSVPVKLVSATKSKDVRFNQLEEATGARIRYRKVSDASGEEVPNEGIVKGYEVSPGKYVVVDEEDVKALAPKASRTIEIEDFVDLEQIDPLYFEQPYYLAPEEQALKPYQLLVEAMTELKKVAIGRIIMRSKERLVAIRPVDGVLCVETMRYVDEVIPPSSVLPEGVETEAPTARELEMAEQLVEALAGDFEPDKYEDSYREQLLGLIEKKAAGEEGAAAQVVVKAAKRSCRRPPRRPTSPRRSEAAPASRPDRGAVARRSGGDGQVDASCDRVLVGRPAAAGAAAVGCLRVVVELGAGLPAHRRRLELENRRHGPSPLLQ